MIGFDTFRCGWDADAIRILPYYCLALRIIALFSSAELFWYFSKFGRGWKRPCGKLRIRYELLRSLRMWYVSLRNERIVADGLYVPSAESVSVCVTGALEIEVGRWAKPNRTPLDQRKCRICNIVEDEFHFLLECELYKQIRKKHIKKYYWGRPNMIKLKELMQAYWKSL